MKKNISLLFSNLAVMLLLAFFSAVLAQEQQIENDEAPVLDYEVEIQKTVSKERQEKNKRFNTRSFPKGTPEIYRQIKELPVGVEPLPTITHFWVGLSALPVEQSTVVVIGEVIESEVHLSEDRSKIYSEFSIRVEKVFKDTSKLVKLNNTVSAHRSGGSIRFASGRVTKYRNHSEGMPQKGEHYLLFLKQSEGGDFSILTGYKLSKGKVMPLDGEDNKDPRAALVFAKYRDVEETRLLQDLQAMLGN